MFRTRDTLKQLSYGSARRRWSLAGIASVPMGAAVIFGMAVIAHYGLPPTMPPLTRWLIVGPQHTVALLGLVLAIVAIIGQRRLWWLGIPGILLNALPLMVLAILIYRRYR
jgi:hypothetical protein